MVQFAQVTGTTVNLALFWEAWDQIQQERPRLADYRAAAKFWASFDVNLRDSSGRIEQVRKDMEINTLWRNPGNPRAASTAFYDRVDAGIGSMKRWLDGGTAKVGTEFTTLVNQLGDDINTVNGYRDALLKMDKVVGTEVVPDKELVTTAATEKISEQDLRGLVQVPDSTAGEVDRMVRDTLARRDRLREQFRSVTDGLVALPHTEKWQGPSMSTPTPGGNPRPGGPSGPGGGPSGPGGGEPGGAPGGPAGAESTPDSSTPGGPGPAGDPTAVGPGAPDPTQQPLTSDPELAGTPSATLNPTTPLPGSTPSTSIPPSGLPGANLSTSPVPSPVPFTPVGGTRPPVPGGGLPGRPGSTVDSLRGTVPGQSVPAEQQVRARGVTPAGSSSSAGHGFYPPMMPMYPPHGGGSGGGIRPGEAEFAGGPIRHAGGRESWRAGLRPQLLGRADERDDEPPPEQPVSGGEVLDEELWQVPGAAPAVPSNLPPEPQQRRGRPWP